MLKQLKEKNVNDDLCINRRAIVKVTRPNIEVEDVFKIDISLCAIPTRQLNMDEYEEQIKNIKKYISRSLKRYTLDNENILYNQSILDINFTSANLKKGYNKAVLVSLFVRSKNRFSYIGFRKKIKCTIKPAVKMIVDKFVVEGYKCQKAKQHVNKKIKDK